jgi:hypothetical protein
VTFVATVDYRWSNFSICDNAVQWCEFVLKKRPGALVCSFLVAQQGFLSASVGDCAHGFTDHLIQLKLMTYNSALRCRTSVRNG